MKFFTLTILFLHSFLVNEPEARASESINPKANLKGWSLHNENQFFNAAQSYQEGLVKRSKVIKNKKRDVIKTISDQTCFSLLLKTKITEKNNSLSDKDQIDLCLKAVNYTSQLFFNVYPNIKQSKKEKLLMLLKNKRSRFEKAH